MAQLWSCIVSLFANPCHCIGRCKPLAQSEIPNVMGNIARHFWKTSRVITESVLPAMSSRSYPNPIGKTVPADFDRAQQFVDEGGHWLMEAEQAVWREIHKQEKLKDGIRRMMKDFDALRMDNMRIVREIIKMTSDINSKMIEAASIYAGSVSNLDEVTEDQGMYVRQLVVHFYKMLIMGMGVAWKGTFDVDHALTLNCQTETARILQLRVKDVEKLFADFNIYQGDTGDSS